MGVCERCSKVQTEIYGSGRFCSAKCARGFSTSKNRAEISKKVSQTLKTGIHCKMCGEIFVAEPDRPYTKFCKDCYWKRHRPDWKMARFENLWNNEVRKKRIFFETGKRECQSCGLSEWMGKPISLELEHINGDRHDHRRENCKVLCPNCHAQTPTWKWRNRKDRKKT